MNRVLITGGAGFIGSHLSEQLQKLGQEVVILDNFSTGKVKNLFPLKPQPLVIIYEVGNTMWGHLPDMQFDTLIHLAAPVSVEESLNNKPYDLLIIHSKITLAICLNIRFIIIFFNFLKILQVLLLVMLLYCYLFVNF